MMVVYYQAQTLCQQINYMETQISGTEEREEQYRQQLSDLETQHHDILEKEQAKIRKVEQLNAALQVN